MGTKYGAATAGEHKRFEMSAARANYILGLLTFSYALSYVDRQLLNLMVDPIKRSLLISDTQFSLLQGTAFVVSYLAAAPVFGRLVDTSSRRNILIFGVLSWSLFTALSGLCDTYSELFLARMGVGVTEACIFPVAWSMIGDCFSAEKTPRALSVFALASQLGGGFSLIAGGLIIGLAGSLSAGNSPLHGMEGWQIAFIVTGLPGVLFALLLLTIREPDRKPNLLVEQELSETKLSLSDLGQQLWLTKNFFGRLLLANGMLATVQLAIPLWVPAFMIRVHGLSTSATGLRLGILSATIAPIATLSGPVFAAWLSRRGYVDATLRSVAICAVPMFVFAFLMPMMPSANSTLFVAALAIFSTGFPVGLLAAATQTATPSRMRGVMGSLFTFSAQVVGYLIGPTVVALLTDRVFGDPMMVGRSLQIVMSVAAVLLCLLVVSVLPQYRSRVEHKS